MRRLQLIERMQQERDRGDSLDPVASRVLEAVDMCGANDDLLCLDAPNLSATCQDPGDWIRYWRQEMTTLLDFVTYHRRLLDVEDGNRYSERAFTALNEIEQLERARAGLWRHTYL